MLSYENKNYYFKPFISKTKWKLNYLIQEGPEPRAPSLCLSVCLSVTPVISGVHGADKQQKNKFGPTYLVRLQFSQPQTLGTSFIFLKLEKCPSQMVSETLDSSFPVKMTVFNLNL